MGTIIRKVLDFRGLPGSISDASSAGSELLGLATQDHQHSYDDYIKINSANGLNSAWQIPGGLDFPIIFRLGNLVIVHGWLHNNSNGPTPKPRTLFTVPEEYRLSDSQLPRIFPGRLMRNGAAVTENYTYDTDHQIKLRDSSTFLDDTLRSISLGRIRYLQK